MLTWGSDIPRWGWGPRPALFPAVVEVGGGGPAQAKVHGCGPSLLAWLLAHNPEGRGGAEQLLDRGTRASIYRSCGVRQGEGHGRLSGEGPAFSIPLNLDTTITHRGLMLSAWGWRWAGSE